MNKKRKGSRFFVGLICLFVIPAFFSACGSEWTQKFIRKRKEVVEPPRFEVNEFNRPYPELYKEHFSYWRSWHRQLIEDLGRNRKRDIRNIRETRRHLESLHKYVVEEKGFLIQAAIDKFDIVTVLLTKPLVSKDVYGIMERRLEGLQYEIDSTLHYKKMKDSFRKMPVDMDLGKYAGAEPYIPQKSVPLEIKPSGILDQTSEFSEMVDMMQDLKAISEDADNESNESDIVSDKNFRSSPPE